MDAMQPWHYWPLCYWSAYLPRFPIPFSCRCQRAPLVLHIHFLCRLPPWMWSVLYPLPSSSLVSHVFINFLFFMLLTTHLPRTSTELFLLPNPLPASLNVLSLAFPLSKEPLHSNWREVGSSQFAINKPPLPNTAQYIFSLCLIPT